MVVNEDRFFLSHRKPIAISAKQAGFDVVIVAKDTGQRKIVENMGFGFIDLPIEPTGMNPIKETRTLIFLCNIYKKEKPDIVHHVGLKNILWGGLAAKITKIKGVVNAVSGLGGLFNGNRLSFTTKMILWIIGEANNRKGVRVIFQNNDDINIFKKESAVKQEQIRYTKGSGIDLNEYHYIPELKSDRIQIIFTGRMVKEKGVEDLISAAEILKKEYSNQVRFILCGRLVPNKTGISKDYLEQHCDGNYICWLGERNDIKSLLEQSHIMAFPSYYREGVPKSLIEASAIGRPIVTCESVGCKDVVDDWKNGFLVPPQNPQKLALALKRLIENKNLRCQMGKEARKKAEKDFSISNVIQTHLNIYFELVKIDI